MRDNYDNNGIWTDKARILRSHIFDRDLQIRGPGSNDGPLTNMSRFLQKLEHCSGENAEVLHNHLKQSKYIIKGFGVEPNPREVVTIVMSSFMEQLGNWVAYHADEILKARQY